MFYNVNVSISRLGATSRKQASNTPQPYLTFQTLLADVSMKINPALPMLLHLLAYMNVQKKRNYPRNADLKGKTLQPRLTRSLPTKVRRTAGRCRPHIMVSRKGNVSSMD